ncbi:MAG: glycerol-3-phosphate dehydrogenase/oxidase [Alcanivoracaceae bacterium]|nr:glycerol-3-phosphate dehydrogenase/oxidase [Alcanivoracaceae bacterium]
MLGQRPSVQSLAEENWDLVVVGGGITGAGVALEAARRGKKTLLVEQRDYAWGTSSRSSKMVHGGLRYIAQGDIKLTRHSLLERERLLQELPELVVRQTYLFPIRKGKFPGRWAMKVILWLYDFLAGIRDHRWVPIMEVARRAPGLNRAGLKGAMSYTDALTDDSRLVMRALHEAASHGARACNYMEAAAVTPGADGISVQLRDVLNGDEATVKARCVINATGAWADRLSGADAKVRPQRGSHLFIPMERLPVSDCLTVMHPRDQRPVFVFPWEGRTCIGTTDLDHPDSLNFEPVCTRAEIDYLLELINSQFPQANISDADIISTMAGVRPIIASGKGVDPSKERRDHAVWGENGVITVSGGKLTTFRLIALDALQAAGLIDEDERERSETGGKAFSHAVAAPHRLGHPLAPMPEGEALREQLAWVLDNEMVTRLDDLLLRRTRLGNLLPDGAAAILEDVRALCMDKLGWDDARWQDELSRYQDIVQRYYSVAPRQAEASAA